MHQAMPNRLVCARVLGTLLVLCIGLSLGLLLPASREGLCGSVSAVMGWTYFAAWTVSLPAVLREPDAQVSGRHVL